MATGTSGFNSSQPVPWAVPRSPHTAFSITRRRTRCSDHLSPHSLSSLAVSAQLREVPAQTKWIIQLRNVSLRSGVNSFSLLLLAYRNTHIPPHVPSLVRLVLSSSLLAFPRVLVFGSHFEIRILGRTGNLRTPIATIIFEEKEC